MPYTTLIDTRTLESLLGDPDLAVVDCRFSLADTAWGEREYIERHIPGAVYAHLDRDLSGEKTGTNGRHPLPQPAALVAAVGRWGIDHRTQVVSYDQDTGTYASRLWWLLRWLGHRSCAVLDGGFRKWTDEGRRTIGDRELRSPRSFAGGAHDDAAKNVDEIGEMIGSSQWTLVDARSPERFRGEAETLDKAAGHIPGARNHFFMRNLKEDGTFQSPAVLRTAFEQTLDGAPADRVVFYCGSGVTACHNLLAMEHAGLAGARLFPGSWSEWSSSPTRPIATEEE